MREKRTYKDLERDIDVLQREIIEATRVQDALHESEHKFRILADSTPLAVMIYQDDRWIFVNKEAENITGYHASELLSKNFWDIVHPDYRELARERGQRRQRGDAVENRYELRILTKEGREKWVYLAGASTAIKGRPAAVISVADITERKQQEEALQKSMERLEIISDSASQLLFSAAPQQIVETLCDRVMRHLDCQVFVNYLVNDQRNCLELNACAGIPEDVAGEIAFLGYGVAVCGCVAKEGCKIVAENIPATPDVRTDLVRSFGITAYACHPLTARGTVIGTLSFGTRSRLTFAEDELSLMKTIADHVAMAMERIRLLKSAEAQAEQLDSRVKERTRLLKRQADLLDLSHDAIVVADLAGRITFWSNGAENTYGFTKAEAIGKFVPGLLRTQSPVPIKNILEIVKREGHWEGELIHTCKNGGRITTHSRWAPRLDEAGNPIEIMEVNRDITLRKQAEEALGIASSYNRNLIEASIDPLVTINPQGRINDVNIATERITGYSRDELTGTDFSDYFTDPEKARKGYQLVFEKGIVRDYELEIRRSDGHLTPVLYNASVYKNESGQVLGIFAAARDITEQRRLEDQLRQSQKMEAIGTLAGGIAHDFNNILAAIIGFSEMIEEDLPENNPSLNHIKKVLKAAGRGQDLVKQILAFSRKTAHVRNILSVASLIQETVGLLKASLPSTVEIRLSINTVGDAVLASPVEVQQVLMNLATNAAFAMRDSGGVLSIELEDINIKRNSSSFKNAVHPGQYIQLTVTDTGSGITRDIMDRVFDPFFTTKGVGEGTGMGLAVVYGIAQSLHGAVSVSSKPGKGATFRVIFPKIQAMRTSEELQPSRVSGGTERILFIDDEALLIEWGNAVLKRLGYKVTALRDPVKAMELFRDQPSLFDLVITDQTMPELTGIRLAKELLSIRPDIPILLCTGHSDVASHDKAKNVGIKQYLMKPLAKQDLARAVRKVLDEIKT